MCTTIVVGEKATADGSFLVARSADSSSLKAQHFVIHPAKTGQSGVYSCKAHGGVNDFTYPLPENAMRFTTVPNWKTQLHGAVGYNEAGLGLTGTESIFASDEALAVDPYNKASGITEDDIPDVILPRCRTAREGVELLGKIIETQGAGEGFGVAFVDMNDVWYLETGSGHQWMAERTPADAYFGSGNQGRLGNYAPADPNQLASPTLVTFATEKGLYRPEDGAFNFSKAYTRDDGRDRVYNDPRVWAIQKHLNPSLEQPVDAGRSFPVYLTPEKKVTLEDMKLLMRHHFEGTEHDPYGNGLNGAEPWRPISVFRTYEAHVMQVRPWLPLPIAEVVYVAFGMADLSCFVPFYHGLEAVPAQYGMGTDHADTVSAYWKYRRLQTLVMTDYPKLAPIVKSAFGTFEAETTEAQKAMEAEFVERFAKDEASALKLLNDFNLDVLAKAEALAEKLLNDVFTIRTADIEASVVFKNNKSKD